MNLLVTQLLAVVSFLLVSGCVSGGHRARDTPAVKWDFAVARPSTQEEAEARVLQLPEVRAFYGQVEQLSRGQVHALIMLDDESSSGWDFYVGENQDDHTVVWNRIRVTETGDVFVLDVMDWTPLDEWRAERAGRRAERLR